jgi:predicted DNA-binding transcriptional regulator AlpA
MAKRKPDLVSTAQLDMFVGWDPNLRVVTDRKEPANDLEAAVDLPASVSSSPEAAEATTTGEPNVGSTASNDRLVSFSIADEWWTLSMVCAYLKVGRKAIWERKRDPNLGFPRPVCLGSNRPRWRSCEIRAWADRADGSVNHK